MDVIIKTSQSKEYRLIFDKTLSRPPLPGHEVARGIQGRKLTEILNKATPSSPKDWPSLWKAVKPTGAEALSDKAKILDAINKLIKHQRLLVQPVAPATASTAGGSPGGGSNDKAPVVSNVDMGPARTDRSAVGDNPDSTGTPHSENTATKASDPTAGGDQEVSKTCAEGDPVSMITGEEMLQYQDCVLPGPMQFAWTRTYRSSHTRDIGLGIAWSHSGSEYLVADYTSLTYFDAEGRSVPFNTPAVNQRSKYLPEGLNLDRLSKDAFVLKQEGQWDKVFTREHASASRFRLSQLRHPSYTPSKTVLGVRQPANGYCIDFTYNEQDLISRIRGNWGKSLRLQRNAQGRVSAIHLSNDTLKQEKRVATYDYNSDGDLIAHRNAKGVGDSYRYQNHLLKQRTLASGFNFYFEWDGEDHTARCIHNWGDRGIYEYYFDWDGDQQRSKATDSRGFQREYRYNDYGQIVEEIDNEGGHHHTRYVDGRKHSYTDPEGHTTDFLYDNENNPAGVRDALGNRTSVGYFKGKPTSFTDKDKTRWQREYNTQGQLVTLIDPYLQRTRYTYNPQGLIASVTDPMQRTTRYHWNSQGELVKIIDALGHARRFHYDNWGQLIRTEMLPHNKEASSAVEYSYNETGLISCIVTPEGETSYTYNANDQLIRHSDPQGRTTEFVYDGLSQVIERIDPEGQHLKYEYDTERNLTALINEKGERYQFFYDGNERLIKEIGFDGRVQHYKYNKAGHLIKHMDAGEILTEFERDPLGQMLGKTCKAIKDPKAEAAITRYQYDAKGRLSETYNDHHYLAFEYTHFGTLAKEHRSTLNSKKQRIKSSFEDIRYNNIWPGQRSGIQLPDGQHIHYQFDQHNLLSSVHLQDLNGQEHSITQLQRDAFGREIAREQGQLTTHSHYDPMGRLQQQQSYHQAQKAPGPIQREYGYDAFGNLSQLTDGDQSTRYVYDFVNRLQKVEGAHEESFSFDPASNLISIDGSPVSKSEGNRLAMQGDRKFTYDARGNLVQENRGKDGKLATFFHYNLNNQLIKVEKDGQSTEYTYDPLGRRTQKTDAFGTTTYLWAGDQMVQERRESSKKTYIFEPESFKPLAMVQDDNIYHYHLDHLGTPQELSDQDGKIVWKARYKTYGNVAVKEVEDVENNLRFQGQYFDEESGLHYNRHRYYNPSIGQFISQDPIGLLGGVNNYQYAPNPTQWVDPLGLKAKPGDCGVARVHHYEADEENPYGHYSVEIISGDKSLHTHQVMSGPRENPGSATTIVNAVEYPSSKPLVKVVEVKLPNATAAMEYQKSQIWQELGEYSQKTNSCIDHVANVLRAGGEDISKGALRQFKYLKGLGF